jgi:hypothetical protein
MSIQHKPNSHKQVWEHSANNAQPTVAAEIWTYTQEEPASLRQLGHRVTISLLTEKRQFLFILYS